MKEINRIAKLLSHIGYNIDSINKKCEFKCLKLTKNNNVYKLPTDYKNKIEAYCQLHKLIDKIEEQEFKPITMFIIKAYRKKIYIKLFDMEK